MTPFMTPTPTPSLVKTSLYRSFRQRDSSPPYKVDSPKWLNYRIHGVRHLQTADLQTGAWVSQTRTSVSQTSASYRYRYRYRYIGIGIGIDRGIGIYSIYSYR